jgi:hypothetical protein
MFANREKFEGAIRLHISFKSSILEAAYCSICVDSAWFLWGLCCWRMVSSGLLRHVALVRTDVSEEPDASFIRVTRIGELGTTQAATSDRRTLRRNTKAPGSSETLVLTRATRRNNPEDTILHSHRRENLKSTLLLFTACFFLRICCSSGDVTEHTISFCKPDTLTFYRRLWGNRLCLPTNLTLTPNRTQPVP